MICNYNKITTVTLHILSPAKQQHGHDKARAQSEASPMLFSTLSQMLCFVFQALTVTTVIHIVQLEFRKICRQDFCTTPTLIMYTFCYSNASHVRSLCERVIIYDSDVCIIICIGLRRNLSNLPAPPKHPSVFDVFTNCTRKSVLLRAFVRKVIKFSQTFAKCDPLIILTA